MNSILYLKRAGPRMRGPAAPMRGGKIDELAYGKTLASKIQPRVERGCEAVAFHSTPPRAPTVSNAQQHDVCEALGYPP